MRLRAYLLSLTLATLLPVALFAAIVGYFLVQEQRETFRRGAEARTLAMSTAVDTALNGSIETLQALATLPALDRTDLETMRDTAERVLAAHPDWSNINLALPSGQQIMNLQRPPGAVLPDTSKFDPNWKIAVEQRAPYVSDLVVGPITGQWDYAVRVPVIRNGSVKFVISAVVKPESLSGLLKAQDVPPDWVAVLLDRSDRIVARTVNPESVGQLASQSLREALAGSASGWFRGSTIEGAAVYTPYRRSQTSGWAFAMGIPASAVDAAAWRAAGLLALALLGALLLAFGFAHIVGRRISAPIGSLASATDAIGRGERVPVPQTARVTEIGRLARTLHECIAAMREREERLQLALDAGRMGNWEWTVQSNKVTWSPDLEAIHGLAPGTFPGTFEAYKKDIHPDDREKVQRAIVTSLEQDEHHVEYRIVRPDGTTRWVEGRGKVFRDDGGTPVRVVGVCSDITERKHAEQALAQRAHLLDLTHDAIFVYDRDFRILYWNPGAQEIYGWKADEVLGKVKHEVLHTEFPQPREQILEEMLRTGRWSGELVHRRRDGARIVVSSRWALERDEKGQIDFVLELNRDITERKQAELALQQADRAKDEFLAMLSHELRNPLAGLTAASHVLNVAEPSSDASKQARGVVERQTKHMSRLVADLLDISRVTLGKLVLQRARINMADIVSNVVDVWRASGRLDSHEVVIAAEPAWVDGDRERIEQIAANLLDNALKFTPAGRMVSITVHREAGDAVLRVVDQGVGLETADCARVFDLFVQAEPAGRAGAGLGIGLALVKRIAELHDGSVSASSDGRGRGSAFTLRLPGVEQPLSRVEAPPVRVNGARSILIVEDNDDARQMLAALLTLGGHVVRSAPDGRTGLALAAAEQPDVVLIDVALPDMDGYEVARSLRAVPAARRLALIAVTGFGQEQDQRRAFEAGFDAHLLKPVSADRLEQVIAELR